MSMALVMGVFLANFPEAIATGAMMHKAKMQLGTQRAPQAPRDRVRRWAEGLAQGPWFAKGLSGRRGQDDWQGVGADAVQEELYRGERVRPEVALAPLWQGLGTARARGLRGCCLSARIALEEGLHRVRARACRGPSTAPEPVHAPDGGGGRLRRWPRRRPWHRQAAHRHVQADWQLGRV